MFELEQQIDRWKKTLVNSDVIGSEDVLELETHLRESMVELQTIGLTAADAFLVATNRLGHPSELQQEYEKNDPTVCWRQRIFWMLTGFLAANAIGGTASAIAAITGTTMAAAGFAGTQSGIAMILVTVFLWMSVFAIIYGQRKNAKWSSANLPTKWVVVMGVLLIVGPVVSLFGRVVQTRIAAPSWLGEAAVYLSMGGVALNLLIVFIAFAALCKLNATETLPVE